MKQENKNCVELPYTTHDARNGLHYTLNGDYYLPDITVESGEPLGKYS